MWLVAAVTEAAQPYDAAALSVGRSKIAQIGDENVLDAVAVQIDDLRVSRIEALVRTVGVEHVPGRRLGVRLQNQYLAEACLADQDIEPALVKKMDEVDVGHCRMG